MSWTPGAYGLTAIVAGVIAALRGDGRPAARPPDGAAARAMHLPQHESSEYRYCTNFAVTGAGLDAREFIPRLEEIGDCVLVVGDQATLQGARPHRRARPGHGDVHPARRGVRTSTWPTCTSRWPTAAPRLDGRRCVAGRGGHGRRRGAACSATSGAHVVDGGPDDEPVDLRHPRRHPRRARRARRSSCRTART